MSKSGTTYLHCGTFETWLREEVVAGHQEYLAAPDKAVPADQILSRIKQRRQSETK